MLVLGLFGACCLNGVNAMYTSDINGAQGGASGDGNAAAPMVVDDKATAAPVKEETKESEDKMWKAVSACHDSIANFTNHISEEMAPELEKEKDKENLEEAELKPDEILKTAAKKFRDDNGSFWMTPFGDWTESQVETNAQFRKFVQNWIPVVPLLTEPRKPEDFKKAMIELQNKGLLDEILEGLSEQLKRHILDLLVELPMAVGAPLIENIMNVLEAFDNALDEQRQSIAARIGEACALQREKIEKACAKNNDELKGIFEQAESALQAELDFSKSKGEKAQIAALEEKLEKNTRNRAELQDAENDWRQQSLDEVEAYEEQRQRELNSVFADELLGARERWENYTPSETPSAAPNAAPSETPSAAPATPSEAPSETPSAAPSAAPAAPNAAPSEAPSETPSETPSAAVQD